MSQIVVSLRFRQSLMCHQTALPQEWFLVRTKNDKAFEIVQRVQITMPASLLSQETLNAHRFR